MKKKTTTLLLALTLLYTLTGCANNTTTTSATSDQSTQNAVRETDANNSKTPVTFVLDWTPNTNHTGVYVAKANGYFDEAGLDVTIVQPPDDGAEVMVGSGQAEFGVSFQDTLAPVMVNGSKSIPVTAIAAVIQHNTSGIMSRKGEGITSPKGMENKLYATWDLPIEQSIIHQCMQDDGGDFDQIEMIPSTITDEVTGLKSGQIDCVWVYYAWAGISSQIQNYPTDFFAFRDINQTFDYYSPVIIGNDDFLSEHPDTAKAFLSAVEKGYRFAIDNPQKAADILCDEVPELDPKLVSASQEYLADQYQADASKWGWIDADRWNQFYQWLNENNLLEEGTIPDNTGFSNDYLPNN